MFVYSVGWKKEKLFLIFHPKQEHKNYLLNFLFYFFPIPRHATPQASEEWFQSQSLTVDTRTVANTSSSSMITSSYQPKSLTTPASRSQSKGRRPQPDGNAEPETYQEESGLQENEQESILKFEKTELSAGGGRDDDSSANANSIDVQIYPIINRYHLQQFFSSNPIYGIWRIYETKKEFVLGIILAIILFLILSILVINTKRKSRLIHKIYLMSNNGINTGAPDDAAAFSASSCSSSFAAYADDDDYGGRGGGGGGGLDGGAEKMLKKNEQIIHV